MQRWGGGKLLRGELRPPKKQWYIVRQLPLLGKYRQLKLYGFCERSDVKNPKITNDNKKLKLSRRNKILRVLDCDVLNRHIHDLEESEFGGDNLHWRQLKGNYQFLS